MHLNHNPHGGKAPAMVRMAAHPTGLQVEDVFNRTLHGLTCIAPLFVYTLLPPLREHLERVLACGAKCPNVLTMPCLSCGGTPTRYMAAVVEQLRQEGDSVQEGE
jgi:hypothetical protein